MVKLRDSIVTLESTIGSELIPPIFVNIGLFANY